MIQNTNQSLSIQDAIQELSQIQRKLEKQRKYISIENTEHLDVYLGFLQKASSLGIILIKHSKFNEAVIVLNKALKVDLLASKNPKHNLSKERIIFYCTMSFAFFK